jgi:tRNA(Ile2) C34 agmatinyltransferase TiaS
MLLPSIWLGLLLLLGPQHGSGTILDFDSKGNILPMAGTYKTVSAIDTAIATIDAPYAMSWAANSEYTYDGNSSVQALAIWVTLNFGNSSNRATKIT